MNKVQFVRDSKQLYYELLESYHDTKPKLKKHKQEKNRQTNEKVSSTKTDHKFTVRQKKKEYHFQKHGEHSQQLDSYPSLDKFWQRKNRQLFYQLLGDKCQYTDRAKQRIDSRQDRKKVQAKTQRQDRKKIKGSNDNLETNSEYLPFKGYTYRNDAYKNSKITLSTKPSTLQKASFKSSQQALNPKASAKPKRQQFFPKNLPQRQQEGYQSQNDMCESQVEQVVVDQSQENSSNYKYEKCDKFQEDMLSNNKSRYYQNGKYQKHDDRGFKKRAFDQQQFLSPSQQPCNQPPIFQSSSSFPTLLQPSTQHLGEASNFKNTNKKQFSSISSKSKLLNDQSLSSIQSKQSGSSAIDSKSLSSAFNFNIDRSIKQLSGKKISEKQQKSVTSDKKEENNEYSYIFKLSEVMDRHDICEDNENKKDVNQGAGKHKGQGNADVQKIKGSAVNSNQQKRKNLKQIGSGQLIESDHNQTQNNDITQNNSNDIELQPIKLQKIQSKNDILRNSISKYNQLQKRKGQLLKMKPKLSIHQNSYKDTQNDILLANNPIATPQHKNNSQHSSIDYQQFDQIFTSSHVLNNYIEQSIDQSKRSKENTGKNVSKKKEDPYNKKTQHCAKSNSSFKSKSQSQQGVLNSQQSIIEKSRDRLQKSQSSSIKKEDASIRIPEIQNDFYHANSEQSSSVHQDNTLKSIDNQQSYQIGSNKKSISSSRPEQVQPSVKRVKSNSSHSSLQNIESGSHKPSQSINDPSHQQIPQQPEFIAQFNKSIDFINPIFTKNSSQSQRSNPHETSLSRKSEQSDNSNKSIHLSQLSSFDQQQQLMSQHQQPYPFSQFKTEWKYMNQKDKWMQQIRSHNQQQSNNFTVIKIDTQEQQSGEHTDSKVSKQQNARLPSLENITMKQKSKTSNSIDLDQSASTFLNFLNSTSNQQLSKSQKSSSQLLLKKISSQPKDKTQNKPKNQKQIAENKEFSDKLSDEVNVTKSDEQLSEQEKNRNTELKKQVPKTANVKLVQVVSQQDSQPLQSSKTLQLIDQNQQSHSPLYQLLQEMDQQLKHIQEMQRIENRYVSSSQDEEEDNPRQQPKKKNTKETISKKKVKLIDSEDMDSFLVKKKHELSKIMEVPQQSKVYDQHNSLKSSLNSNKVIVSKAQKHSDTSEIVSNSSLSQNRIKKLQDDQNHEILKQDHSDINNESFGELTIIEKKPSQDVRLGSDNKGYDHEEHSEIDLNELLEKIEKINSEIDDGHNPKQHALAINSDSSNIKRQPQLSSKNPLSINPNPQPSKNPPQLPILNKSQSKSSHTSQQSSTDLRKYRQSLNQIKNHVDKSYNQFSSIMNISKQELKRIAPDQNKGIDNPSNRQKTHSYRSDSQSQTPNNSSFSFPEHQPSQSSITNPKQNPALPHSQQSNIFQIKPIQTSFKSINSIDQSFVENYLPENIKRKSSTKKVSISKIPQKLPQKASPFFDMSSNSINFSKDSNNKSYDKKSNKMHSRTQSDQHDHSIRRLSSKQIMEMFGQFSQCDNPQPNNLFKTQSFIKNENSDSQETKKISFKRTESKK